MNSDDQGVRYPPNRLRDGLHRLLFGLAAALGPRWQDRLLRGFFEMKYRHENPWSYEATPYQKHKAGQTLALIEQREYQKVLEVGCGEGVFSELLLRQRQIRQFLGIDVSARAIERAQRRCRDFPAAQFQVSNILQAELGTGFDLIILCEILYYLGDAVKPLAERVPPLLAPGGRVVLVHPWPEAEQLHAHFIAQPRLALAEQVVDSHPLRPFCIAVLETVRRSL